MVSVGWGRGRGRGLLVVNVGLVLKFGLYGEGEMIKVCKDYRVIISFEFFLLVFKMCCFIIIMWWCVWCWLVVNVKDVIFDYFLYYYIIDLGL